MLSPDSLRRSRLITESIGFMEWEIDNLLVVESPKVCFKTI